MQIVSHDFVPTDLVAGHPALDFANTATARDRAVPVDWLDDFGRLIEWALLAKVVDSVEADTLMQWASSDLDAAHSALARAKRLREAIYEVVFQLAHDGAAPASVSIVEEEWKAAVVRARLERHLATYAISTDPNHSGLDIITHRVALSFVALLETFNSARTRMCQGPGCGWLFVDTSRAGRRVWCDMATCGNAAKGRRHYARTRHSEKAASHNIA